MTDPKKCGNIHPNTIGAVCELPEDHTTEHEANVFTADNAATTLVQWKRWQCGLFTASLNGKGETRCTRNAGHEGEHRP